jgi:hypothetical protein
VGAPEPWPKGRAEREVYLEKFEDFDVLLIGNAIREHTVVEDAAKN